MIGDDALMAALRRHWDYAGRDEDASHEIYHDDAVLKFPQSGERFEGVKNFREWRRQYPSVVPVCAVPRAAGRPGLDLPYVRVRAVPAPPLR